jgi:hypothetical protein
MEHDRQDIVLTGPGRSGTTLACYLLNKLPDAVALAEPIPPGKFGLGSPDYEALVDGIEQYYRRMREMALRQGVVVSKHVGGEVPANTKGVVDGVRQRVAQKGKIPVGKELKPDFSLIIKQPRLFTALLPTLVKRFPCYAVVRNPLAVMASRKSLNPKKKRTGPRISGKWYAGELSGFESITDPMEAEIRVLDFFFERYLDELPEEHILRYEDLVRSGGKALEVVVPAARELDEPLEVMNDNPLYDREYMLEAGEKLLASDGAFWSLYSKEDVENVLSRIA